MSIKQLQKGKVIMRCVNYCGVTCVNGQCPTAISEIFPECEPCTCEECAYYMGCEDCCFADKNKNCVIEEKN